MLKVLQPPLLDKLRFATCLLFHVHPLNPICHLPPSLSLSQADVLWVDTGKTLSISLRSLYPLPHVFLPSSLPPLAIPAVLEGLQSTFQGEGQWFPLDVQLLWKHLLQKKVGWRAGLSSHCAWSGSLPPQLHARFTGSPSATRPGRVDLYFDPGGERRVVDTLAREGYHLRVAPAATPPPAEACCLATSGDDTQSSSSVETGDSTATGLSTNCLPPAVANDSLPGEFPRACRLVASPWQKLQQLACQLDGHEI